MPLESLVVRCGARLQQPLEPGEPFDIARSAMAKVPERTYRDVVALLTTFDLRGNLEKISVPVLVVAGEADRLAPPQMMEKMASRIPGARFELMAGTGHLAPIEQPDTFNGLIDEFLGNTQ